ncbi:la ribonucleoprotein [Vairimorpha apis BRL 01]|uniref:La ribonucleoprotein n=1 Tax=Vairimorpha apis BRL 01 TaxID=1037528 RepID=T0MFM8_9MICR|nr:la ribonucleoprotein [Vairimorpha apis BRL 01]
MTLNKIKNKLIDTFLKQQALINNGYIPIKTILTFKKMRELEATEEKVIDSIKNSNVVELKDGCLKKIETDEFKSYICESDIDSRCLYISGFDKNMNFEELENILKSYMTPLLIRMRLENEEKKVKEAKEALKSDFLNKLFKYEINKEVSDIAVIKNLVSDVAFVDLNEKVIRLKFSKDFENKEYEKDDMKINITKLNKKEVEEYCNKIPKKNSNKDNKKKSEKLTKRTNENEENVKKIKN